MFQKKMRTEDTVTCPSSQLSMTVPIRVTLGYATVTANQTPVSRAKPIEIYFLLTKSPLQPGHSRTAPSLMITQGSSLLLCCGFCHLNSYLPGR